MLIIQMVGSGRRDVGEGRGKKVKTINKNAQSKDI